MQNFCNHPGWNAELCRALCVRGEMGQMALAAEGLAGGPALGVVGSSGASYGSIGGSRWLKWRSPTTGRGRSAARQSRAAAG
jgi:hypothetical protein